MRKLRTRINCVVVSISRTHRVCSYSQALLDESFKCGLKNHVLIRDGLLHDLLSGHGLQRLGRGGRGGGHKVISIFT